MECIALLHCHCNLQQMTAVQQQHFTDIKSVVRQFQRLPVGFTANHKWQCRGCEGLPVVRQLNFSSARYGGSSASCSQSQDRTRSAEELWHQFFLNPLSWWDHRKDKVNHKYPDFKHKKSQEALWVEGRSTPEWAKTKLSVLVPGTIQRSVFSWTAEINRYVRDGQFEKALEHFKEMLREGVSPDNFTFVPVLKACASLGALEEGSWVHAMVIESQYQRDLFVASCLIDMYSKCGRIENACRVFYNLQAHDLVCWGAMIMGYVNCGQEEKALALFEKMHHNKVQPDSQIFVGVLKACARLEYIDKGRDIHALVALYGLESNIFVGACLIDMYGKCGAMEDACRVFEKMPIRNVVCWSAMIMGHVKCGQAEQALKLFEQMQQEQVDPDSTTFVGVLNACAGLEALEHGRRIHAQIMQKKVGADLFVGSALIDMYAKCGSIDDACMAFNSIQTRNVVSWSAMIAGFVKCGQEERALRCYQEMQREQIEPNSVTFVSVLNACANIAALEEGRCIHAQVIQNSLESHIFVGSCLVDMYSKCGSIEEAVRVFNNMPQRNVITWNAMIMGYAMHGLGKEALHLFEKLCQGVCMNINTFVCLLSACAHVGLVDRGLYYFESMCPVYDVPAKPEHYSCIVDILGRYGHLDMAEDFVGKMWAKPDVHVWMTLLASCRAHGNVWLGEWAAKNIMELDPKNESAYVLLSNIYAGAGNETQCSVDM
ncbi:hypothetical protein O6H91_12G045900 [Diphasiastrum complanatum]|uniref:Uncharacterized protein n=1 Tax=Diphasiastrum complanatum TaxID=34168 RepID=A0ACC2C195_DIPCM|nr:hypothetical protein O6H91_12G045900 [Diphasiastrum complanatum]